MGRILLNHTDIRKEQKPVTSLQENSPTPLKSICLFRSYFEGKTSFVVRQILLRIERFIKDQMKNGTKTLITKCSLMTWLGTNQFFYACKKKSVEVGCTLSKIILLLTTFRRICNYARYKTFTFLQVKMKHVSFWSHYRTIKTL